VGKKSTRTYCKKKKKAGKGGGGENEKGKQLTLLGKSASVYCALKRRRMEGGPIAGVPGKIVSESGCS